MADITVTADIVLRGGMTSVKHLQPYEQPVPPPAVSITPGHRSADRPSPPCPLQPQLQIVKNHNSKSDGGCYGDCDGGCDSDCDGGCDSDCDGGCDSDCDGDGDCDCDRDCDRDG